MFCQKSSCIKVAMGHETLHTFVNQQFFKGSTATLPMLCKMPGGRGKHANTAQSNKRNAKRRKQSSAGHRKALQGDARCRRALKGIAGRRGALKGIAGRGVTGHQVALDGGAGH